MNCMTPNVDCCVESVCLVNLFTRICVFRKPFHNITSSRIVLELTFGKASQVYWTKLLFKRHPPPHTHTHSIGICVNLFRVVKTTLSSSYNISGLIPVCWLLFQCF